MENSQQTPSADQTGAIEWPALRQRLRAVHIALELGFVPSPAERTAILRARAQALAQEVADHQSKTTIVEVVEFVLGDERYGFESTFVREVYPLKELTPVPCTPSFVLGIVNIRGQIISVIDLKKFFGLPEKGLTDLNRILVLRAENRAPGRAAGQDKTAGLHTAAGMEFGVLADEVLGMNFFSEAELQSLLPTLTGMRKEFLKGVTSEGMIILDTERVLADARIIVHEEVEHRA